MHSLARKAAVCVLLNLSAFFLANYVGAIVLVMTFGLHLRDFDLFLFLYKMIGATGWLIYLAALPELLAIGYAQSSVRRWPFVHMILGGLVGIVSLVLVAGAPIAAELIKGDMSILPLAGQIAFSGSVGGLIYWLIAGRRSDDFKLRDLASESLSAT